MKLFLVLVLSLLAIVCLADVSHVKHHKHQRHHHSREHEDEDEESHYLPPKEEKDAEQPYYKKEKHTSEVVYHKEEDHEEPKHYKEYTEHHHEEPKKQRVDHYHHYDKKPEVKTQHIHYKHSKPHVRTDYNQDLFTPAATQVVYRRRRPSRILYASAPNSVFHTHTQINVQSQDSELNSLTRPDPAAGAQDPAAQAPTGAQAPGFRPNCQFIGPGNVSPGCGPSDPVGAQLPASALAPTGANLPASQPIPGGQLAVLGNGQRPPSRPGGYGGYGGGNRLNFFVDPSLGAQLGAIGNAAGNQQAAGGGQLGAGQLAGGAQLGNGQLAGGAQLGAGQGFDPSFGGQAAAGAPFNPSFGAGQAQRPVQGQYDPNLQLGGPFDPSGSAQLGAGQGVSNQRPNAQAPFDPSSGAQLGAGQGVQNQRPNGQASFDPALGAQLGTGQGFSNQRPNPVNAPQGAQLAAGQGAFDPNQGQFDPSIGAQLAAGQVPRLNNRRPPNRSNYQGLNVLNGNVFGQPHLQGPTSALGNQQDTNIIDGNFYSDPHHGHHRALVSVNPNQRSVLLADEDDADDDAQSGFLGFAASNRQSSYVVAPKKHRSHRSSSKRNHADQGTSASQYDTDYREDGYHYQKPKHSFEF